MQQPLIKTGQTWILANPSHCLACNYQYALHVLQPISKPRCPSYSGVHVILLGDLFCITQVVWITNFPSQDVQVTLEAMWFDSVTCFASHRLVWITTWLNSKGQSSCCRMQVWRLMHPSATSVLLRLNTLCCIYSVKECYLSNPPKDTSKCFIETI